MSLRVLVVGSGASGVHFALTALARGHQVTMVDVGHEGPTPPLPEADFTGLKDRLPDPVGYFLGAAFQGVVAPDHHAEYYGFPPSKDYVFRQPEGFAWRSSGFEPLFSFARGGLAEAWTGGCYPFNDDDLGAFPFSYADLAPHYEEVARRIGVTGAADDLARFLPLHANLLPPLELDPHSALLVERYERQRPFFHGKLGCYLGRTRVATLSQPLGARQACAYLGRCLWGCPIDALYTPSQTLKECLAHPAFRYLPGLEARHFRCDGEGRATALVAVPAGGGGPRELPLERLVLAAGTLQSTAIMLRSVRAARRETVRLPGLMDNRQILVPFVNLRLIGRPYRADRYQYHLVGLGLETGDPRTYVHGQLTTLKTALLHPIAQRLPLDLATALSATRSAHAALGVVNLNFHDTSRPENCVTLAGDGDAERLEIRYVPPPDEPARLRAILRRLRRALWRLGCFVPPGMAHVRPMGASVHYAGTLPMSRTARPWTTDETCRSREFPNVYLVDGATYPFLPAKNLTFTLMANAVRVATLAF